jgi:hypothetical protein
MSTQPSIELVAIGTNALPDYIDAQSEEGSGDFQPATRLLGHHVAPRATLWRRLFKEGGLGEYFLGTSIGWQVWLGLLVFWTGGCGFGLLLMNRFIMLTGIYK